MSRICIKGIPKECNEAQLVTHISAVAADLTDVKIARTKDGRSRQFAFIGFKGPETADRAIKHFDKSFMGSCRLAVEQARAIGDDSVLQRAWSKHTKGKVDSVDAVAASKERDAADAAKGSKRKRQEDSADVEKERLFAELGLGKAARRLAATSGIRDPAKLKEFLAAVAPRTNAPTWADDDAQGRQKILGPSQTAKLGLEAHISSEEASRKSRHAGDEIDDGASTDSGEYDDMPGTESSRPATKKRKVGTDKNAAGVEEADVPSKPGKDIGMGQGKGSGAPGTVPTTSAVSDLDYLKSKKSVKAFDENEDENNDEDDDMNADEDDSAPAPNGQGTRSRSKAQASRMDDEEGQDKAEATVDEAGENEDLSETGRLFVRNLPYGCSEEELRDHFVTYGPIAEISLVHDSAGKCKGFGYVTFVIPEHAVLALPGTDGKVFQGRLLHILPAKPLPVKAASSGGEDAEGGRSTYKSSKEEKRRAGAGSAHESTSVWNTLFIRSDAAVAAAAAGLGVSRSELLDRDAKNTAVRAALAEASVIAETKAFLVEEGVVLDALEKALESGESQGGKGNTTSAGGARSNTVILVKNLPPDADVNTLRELFGRHGLLARFVLPPAKVLALVEYVDSAAAKRAFGALAYARFQRVPLYLEWAPQETFAKPAQTAQQAPPAPTNRGKDAKKVDKSAPVKADAPKEVETKPAAASASKPGENGGSVANKDSSAALPAESRTVFVKNLSFATSEEGLQEVAARAGPIRSVRLPKKKNPKWTPGSAPGAGAPNEWLSMGYGFVEYARAEDAQGALRTLQGVMLDGHALQFKVSESKTGPAAAASPAAASKARVPASKGAPDANATKLIVRNLAFEATRNELQELFSSYGTLRSVRLPRKMDGTTRGFGFVEFLTHEEAVTAKGSLGAAHLYGRHLVIEWASSSEGGGEGAGGAGDAANARVPSTGASPAPFTKKGEAGAQRKTARAPEPAAAAPAPEILDPSDPRSRVGQPMKYVKAPAGTRQTFS